MSSAASETETFTVLEPDGRARGAITATTRKPFHCGGAGASSRDGHTVPALSPAFRFTRAFHYGGALYTGGYRICLTHAQQMGLIQEFKMSAKRKVETFTPGPWTITDTEVDGDDQYYRIEAKGYGTVALVDATPVDDDSLRANARLIAAAPEMVAFIKNIAAYSYHDISRNSALLVDARALLARVEGN